MILKMTDRTEMYVSRAEGDSIRKALTKSETGFLTVRGTTIKKTAVLKLEEGGTDPLAPGFFDKPKTPLESGKRCRAQYSIQREINDIAKNEHPHDWAKYIKSTKWREATRLKLRQAKDVVWCDAKAGECACE